MRRFRFLVPAAFLVAWGSFGAYQSPETVVGDEDTRELIAQEQTRTAVEQIIREYLEPVADGALRIDKAIESVDRLAAIGPPAVPFVANELDRSHPATFDLCAYALGRIGSDEAIAALRRTIARADQETGTAPRAIKAWACWGLALQGQADVVALAVGGQHDVAGYSMHGKTSLLETVALQTGSKSLAPLLEVLAEAIDDSDRWKDRRVTLRALRRLGDPAAAPKLISLLDNTDVGTRHEAANALRTMGTSDAVRALVGLLGDEELAVRRSAAYSLEYIGDPAHREAILGALSTESDALIRGSLYRLLAETGGEKAFDLLEPFVSAGNAGSRRYLVEALGLVDDRRRLVVLDAALDDADNGVALKAVTTLGQIESAPAIESLTECITSCRLLIARVATEELTRLRARRSAPAIAGRLLSDDLLGRTLPAVEEMVTIDRMGHALTVLAYAEALQGIREARERQTDISVIRAVDAMASRLETVKTHRNNVARWVATAESSDRDLRLFAYEQLGRIGNAKAANALALLFERSSDIDERVEILRAAGPIPSTATTALIEQVLLDPEFDPIHHVPMRDMAAWGARQLGGNEMFSLLQEAARRRNGRDVRVMIYAALVGGERALPLLGELRQPRMRYLGWSRGIEQERLDWVASQLAHGRSLAKVDVSPEKIFFR